MLPTALRSGASDSRQEFLDGREAILAQAVRFGIHDEPTQDPIHCALLTTEGILEALLSSEAIDLEAMIDGGFLRTYGDERILERFLSFAETR